MRSLSRVFFRCVSTLLIVLVLIHFFVPTVLAQTQQPVLPTTQSYTTPNVEQDVPLDQHTYVQSMFLELMIAIQCQLVGIDFTSPTKSCLGINTQTGKLGYAPQTLYQNGQVPIGGVMGMMDRSISAMFVPVVGSQEYIRYMAGNFGVVKSAMAAPATGFDGLSPILGLWKTTRDIAYYVLLVAFIFIGIGVMLRVKIDPRTVMTVQNQIPRVIICIILITFSYAIAGLLIDTMWAVTYMGINVLTSSVGSNPQIGCASDQNTLSKAATSNILQTPLKFFNETFMEPGCATGGILDLSGNVGSSMAAIQSKLLIQLFGLECDFHWWDAIPIVGQITLAYDASTCALNLGFNSILKWLIALVWILIALVIIIISLLRIWFALLKAYAMIFIYVILGPLWIVMGLLPKKPLGFEKWIRVIFANLSVFTATALLMVFARVLTDKFATNTVGMFIPPLVGNPGAGELGGLIAFAILLVTPSVLDTLREKLGVPSSKAYQGAVQTFNAGRQAATLPAKQGWKHLNKRDQQGAAIGPLARKMDTITGGLADKAGNIKGLGWIGRQHRISEAEKSGYGGGRIQTKIEEAFKRQNSQGQWKSYDEWKESAQGKETIQKAYSDRGYNPYRPEFTPPAAGAGAGTPAASAAAPGTTTQGAQEVHVIITTPDGQRHHAPVTGQGTGRSTVLALTNNNTTIAAEFAAAHADIAGKESSQITQDDANVIGRFLQTRHADKIDPTKFSPLKPPTTE